MTRSNATYDRQPPDHSAHATAPPTTDQDRESFVPSSNGSKCSASGLDPAHGPSPTSYPPRDSTAFAAEHHPVGTGTKLFSRRRSDGYRDGSCLEDISGQGDDDLSDIEAEIHQQIENGNTVHSGWKISFSSSKTGGSIPAACISSVQPGKKPKPSRYADFLFNDRKRPGQWPDECPFSPSQLPEFCIRWSLRTAYADGLLETTRGSDQA